MSGSSGDRKLTWWCGDRGGLEDSGGMGQTRGNQPGMERHPRAGDSWNHHHPEPKGAKRGN